MIHVIAFMGKVQSGKDTAAEVIRSHYVGALGRNSDIAVVQCSFAEPLKRMVYDIFGVAFDVPRSAFYGTQDEKAELLKDYDLPHHSGRTILQRLGTEFFRAIHPKVWAEYLRKAQFEPMQEELQDGEDLIMVITDARFLSEIQVVHDMGGKIVKLTRNSEQEKNVGIQGHASEMEQDLVEPDFVIDNRDTTLEQFEEDVRRLTGAIIELNTKAAAEETDGQG